MLPFNSFEPLCAIMTTIQVLDIVLSLTFVAYQESALLASFFLLSVSFRLPNPRWVFSIFLYNTEADNRFLCSSVS